MVLNILTQYPLRPFQNNTRRRGELPVWLQRHHLCVRADGDGQDLYHGRYALGLGLGLGLGQAGTDTTFTMEGAPLYRGPALPVFQAVSTMQHVW